MIDKKTLRNDLILILSLFVVAAIALVVIISTRRKDNLFARISVQNNVKERNITSVSENSDDQALENAMYSMMREKERNTWKSQQQENSESNSLDY